MVQMKVENDYCKDSKWLIRTYTNCGESYMLGNYDSKKEAEKVLYEFSKSYIENQKFYIFKGG